MRPRFVWAMGTFRLQGIDTVFGFCIADITEEIPACLVRSRHDATDVNFAIGGDSVQAGTEGATKSIADGLGVHFQLLPLISRGAAGWRCCLP